MSDKIWARLLLVAMLATSVAIVGCGDDDDGDTDAAVGDGDGDGDAPTCEDMVAQSLSSECRTCLCDGDEANASQCGEDCLALIDCAVVKCEGDTGCATLMCISEITAVGGVLAPANAVGPMLYDQEGAAANCMTTCDITIPDTDAGM